MAFTFDWSVNISALLTLALLILGIVSYQYGLKSDVKIIKNDVNILKEQQRSVGDALTSLGKILTQVAVQDSRIAMMEKSIDELRHGQGFIKGFKVN